MWLFDEETHVFNITTNGIIFKEISVGNISQTFNDGFLNACINSLGIDYNGNIYTLDLMALEPLEVGNGFNLSPILLMEGSKFKNGSAGSYHSLAVDNLGDLYAWGSNSRGQLGDGTTTQKTLPVLIMSGTKFKSINAGEDYSLGIDESGNLYGWGANWSGQLGDGTEINKLTPTLIASGIRFKDISAGSSHSLGIDEHNNLYAWGNNEYGQLGRIPNWHPINITSNFP